MAQVKLEMNKRVEDTGKQAEAVMEKGESDLESAQANKAILESFNKVDDEDIESVETGNQECRAISTEMARTEVTEPGNEINESFSEIVTETTDYANIEHSDADKASGMSDNYEGVGSSLNANFEKSASDFETTGNTAESTNSEYQASYKDIASALEGTF